MAARGGSKPADSSMIWLTDPRYPERLKQIHDPPARLFVRGELPAGPMIAIIGSRRATPYGERVANRLARELSEAGIVIVSGLARGIDGAAHRGALAGPTPTVAVMATGLDLIYPPEHAELARQIVETGALLTEAEEGTQPLPGYFPVRNRIISGLSLGVLVVEAAERSGALITARMALEQGRDVFCVPGSIENPVTIGTHQLIKEGAKLVQTVEDVLEEYPGIAATKSALTLAHTRTRARARADSEPQDPQLRAVWELLDWVEPRHHDELTVMMKLDARELNRRLTLLEMSGYILGGSGGLTRRPQA